MTDAPREIWARPEHSDENSYGGFWIKHPVQPATRYIRADAVLSIKDVDHLAQIIREVDGNNTLGAGALAEAILAKLEGTHND